MTKKNIPITVRFSRDHLIYMCAALRKAGEPCNNLSEMIRMAIGQAVNSIDPTIIHNNPDPVSAQIIDSMIQGRVPVRTASSNPFGNTSQMIHQQVTTHAKSETVLDAEDPELKALSTFKGMGKFIKEFELDQRSKATNLWTYLQQGYTTIAKCLWDDGGNRESEFITAHLLNSTGFFASNDDLRTKYKARCEEIIKEYEEVKPDEPV